MIGATALAAACAPVAKALARRFGIMDEPGPRKVHSSRMPRTGGFAVYLAYVAVVLVGYFGGPVFLELAWVRENLPQVARLLGEAYRVQAKLLALLGGATLAFLVGLADDVFGRRFPVGIKAAGQVLAAAVLVAADVRTSFLPWEWLNVLVTLLWVVGMTNAFNLLDNMDGLSAGVAFVAAAVFLVNAWALDEYFISLMLLALMGSLLGFLFFNFPPASIFLGDCGTHFIGYAIASLTLLERYVSHASGTLFPVLMPVLVLAVPIMDTAAVVVIRLREGRPIYVGDKRHLSHRLVELGFSARGAVLVLYLLTFSLGLGAGSLPDANLFQALLILLQSGGFVAAIMLLLFVRRPERLAG